ncbi:hypothetical protein BC939DRAFT_443546 [Gamsiella multidivaricata]|uniref:uncharacterized protein n=1 Tax=Gamsiella multidivaricata TaxID=101098 RepID=UPI00221E54E1|nr:uncharacterized protein BC939DRAFT_443546 [Gamsiella multidivaricata]KAI7828671.1 hypothetical protein BC939DRAFT_443546 [Gamsiella multidivaricata]
MEPLMEGTSVDTLNALLRSIAADKQLNNDHLMALMHLCGHQGDLATAFVMGALRLLDIPDSVERLVAHDSERTIYKVRDLESGISLTCRPALRHCTCDRFVQVLMSDAITCEHVLAAQLSEALGIMKETVISDESFVEYL